MSWSVKSNIHEAQVEMDRLRILIKSSITEILDRSGRFGQARMRQYAPVLTGRLRESITIEKSGDQVVVAPHVPYAVYVEYGTRPSPGRYVPAIGKRLVNPTHPSFGRHPGIKPQRFIQRAYDDTRTFARDLALRLIRSSLESAA